MTSCDIVKLSASSLVSLLAMSLVVGSALAERVGQGEVGGCTHRVQTASLCLGSAMSLPSCRLALGRPFLSFLAYIDLEQAVL